MKIQNPSSQESLETFKVWWQNRINRTEGQKPIMPDFFEVWDSCWKIKQKEIEQLKGK